MPRCGCGTATCACSVTQGDNITVTGNGSTGNPYVISATPDSLVTVLDTPEVDMTITGAGTVADPYVISSNVLLSTDPNNCLTNGTDGALFVPCPDGSETIVTPGAGVSVTGSGTTGDPYVVSSIAADGDTFVISGNGTTVTGSGTALDPYIPNVDTGCGLEVVADLVQANVAAWPFACDQDVTAQGVYCSPTTGQLQSPPDRLTAMASIGQRATVTTSPENAEVCDGVTLNVRATGIADLVVTNPDPCRSMLVVLEIGGRMQVDIAQNAFDDGMTGLSIDTRVQYQVNGGGFIDASSGTWSQGTVGATPVITVGDAHTEIPGPHIIVPPGGAATIDTRVGFFCTNGAAGQAAIQRSRANLPAVRATGWSI